MLWQGRHHSLVRCTEADSSAAGVLNCGALLGVMPGYLWPAAVCAY